LFYGRAISYILSEKGQRSKEEWWCDIKIDVATGPRDIYAAIDGAFDIQKVNVESSVAEQYATISKLPPILQIQVQPEILNRRKQTWEWKDNLKKLEARRAELLRQTVRIPNEFATFIS
jgi:ubiquitin carboxyl-terminal hydrolase 25/28